MKRVFGFVILPVIVIAIFVLGIDIADAETNKVPWSFYEYGGHLVINGENPKYGVATTTGTLDLNNGYMYAPWSYSKEIINVEFAALTAPKSMERWFKDCINLKSIDSTNLDTSDVTNMSHVFEGCTSLSDLSGLSSWNVSSVTDMRGVFDGCTALTDLSGLSSWDLGSPNMQGMFNYCTSLRSFSGLEDWDVGAATNMTYLFQNCTSLTDLSAISGWYFSERSLYAMFFRCTSLSDLSPLSGWDVGSVTDTSSMFKGCTSLSDLSPLSGWDVGSVTSMYSMFEGCTSLSNLSGLSSWDLSSVTDMRFVFEGCTTLFNLSPISNWNVSSVMSMSSMFKDCTSLIIARLYDWMPANGCNTSYMFQGCTSLETIYCRNSWNCNDYYKVSGVWKYQYTFDNCTSLTSKTTGQAYGTYRRDAKMANPVTGLFTIPPEEKTTISIQKVVLSESGEPIQDWNFLPGQFEFEILSNSGAPLPDIVRVQTDGTGKAIWPEISYSENGEYTYQVREIAGGIPGVTYDTSPHELKVTVSSDEL